MTDIVEHDSVWAALGAAQGDCGPLVKNAKNPHFNSDFANLSAVLACISQPISDHGLVMTQLCTTQDLRTCLTTVLTHPTSGGEMIESTAYLAAKDPDNPQNIVAAITYFRRAQLVALFGLSAEDDDGNKASDVVKERAPRSNVGETIVRPARGQQLVENGRAGTSAYQNKPPAMDKWTEQIEHANIQLPDKSKYEWAHMVGEASMWKDAAYFEELWRLAPTEAHQARVVQKAHEAGVELEVPLS